MERTTHDRLHVRVSPWLRDALQQWARDEEETISVLVRRILRVGVAQRDSWPLRATTHPIPPNDGDATVAHDPSQAEDTAEEALLGERASRAGTEERMECESAHVPA